MAAGEGHEDLGLESVVDATRRSRRCLSNLQTGVGDARGRVSALAVALKDEEAASERAATDHLLASVRLREARRAVLKVRARVQDEDQERSVRQRQLRQERDADRAVASQLKLRVDMLSTAAGKLGVVLEQMSSKLCELLQEVASELDFLEQDHLRLHASAAAAATALTTQTKTAGSSNQLMLSWAQAAGPLDRLTRDRSRSNGNNSKSPTPCQALLSDTEKRTSSLHQLRLNIGELHSSLK